MNRMPALFVAASCAAWSGAAARGQAALSNPTDATVALPAPRTTGTLALESALARRRSERAFDARPIPREQLGQLLWAGQGVTSPADGRRTAPSAGALYPLELYVAAPDGVFRYVPAGHRLARVAGSDVRAALARAAQGQRAVGSGAVDLVVVGVPSRTRVRYGARAERYVQLEAGHAAQNVLLEAVALGLGAAPIGAFDDDAVARALALPAGSVPLYIIPIGALAPR